MGQRKGISLTLETVVLLILAAVVLAALLGFFLGTFTPASGYADAVRTQTLACQKIIIKDNQCRAEGEVSDIIQELIDKKVCNADSPTCTTSGSGNTIQNCIRSCCKAFCPG